MHSALAERADMDAPEQHASAADDSKTVGHGRTSSSESVKAGDEVTGEGDAVSAAFAAQTVRLCAATDRLFSGDDAGYAPTYKVAQASVVVDDARVAHAPIPLEMLQVMCARLRQPRVSALARSHQVGRRLSLLQMNSASSSRLVAELRTRHEEATRRAGRREAGAGGRPTAMQMAKAKRYQVSEASDWLSRLAPRALSLHLLCLPLGASGALPSGGQLRAGDQVLCACH